VFTGATLAVPLRPSVKAYFDVDSIRGAYVTFDVSHSVAMPKPHPRVSWSVELAAGAGWGSSGYSRSNFGVDRQGLVDFHPSLGMPVEFGKHWRLTPRLGYATLVQSALRQSGVPAPHGFVGGLALGFTY
jgi:outer membrane scaffolding protein for murein synthesis (MipA/OmpV family)